MKVRLSEAVLNHIISRHPEMKPYVSKILETASNPDIIFRGSRGETKALKFYSALRVGSKHLVVFYHEVHGEKVIITSYFTSNTRRVKGEVIWRK